LALAIRWRSLDDELWQFGVCIIDDKHRYRPRTIGEIEDNGVREALISIKKSAMRLSAN
jgi:hypothetical protein